jgi:hypothetical protein
MEENGMTQADHPLYSLGLIPSDFDLFGYIKSSLNRTSFDEREDLSSAFEDMLGSIEKSTLDRVFLEWMESFQRCIDTNYESLLPFNRQISRLSPGGG